MNNQPVFSQHRVVTIPEWAEKIQLICNGIDGWPPFGYMSLTPEAFVATAHDLQYMQGGGEWDVLVYATRGPTVEFCPYGVQNPYRGLRSRKGGRVRKLAAFSYMAGTLFAFQLQPKAP